MYNQISNLIRHKADTPLKVVPASYPAAPIYMFISNVVSILQMFFMAILFTNDKLLPASMRENKMASVFGIFLGANMVAGGLTKTDAFEIYVGKKLVFSKFSAGRLPNGPDLVNGFRRIGITLDI